MSSASFSNFQEPAFVVSNSDSMADEDLNIILQGVPAETNITITLSVSAGARSHFNAFGQYCSDYDGKIDLSVSESVNGTYTGTDSMGLFWSLKPKTGQKKGLRLLPNIFKPSEYKISAYVDHIDCFDNVRPIAETTIRRKWIADNVSYQHVRSGRIRGILFIPKSENPLPAILDIYGSGGGIMPHRAALFASKGFVTLSLAFYRYDDLPHMMDEIDLEYFLEAIDYLKCLDFVQPDAIGAIGLSKGADIMLYVASLTADIKALALVNGLSALYACNFRWNGGSRKPLWLELSRVEEEEDGSLTLCKCGIDNITESDVYPIEQIKGKIIIFASADDKNVSSVEHARLLLKRLEKFGKADNCTLVKLEGAGHLLDPVYMPHCSCMVMKYIGNYLAAMGGNPAAHHLGQVLYWKTVIDFFKQNLEVKQPRRHKL